ncbi:uncharacterized protein LOC122508206 [Leptopilina heterotoma]|uniref:uncharacterized protein LOC122508206 n=1 Tax=Leptopilina heterotoma TaxID=63436 RepID=UPI001CA835FC|nr:uncharacterized protein LOC122508206 [Leptopilina heterotoma]
MARKRFFMLERRLEKNPDLKLEYHKFMSSYLELNHMEPSGSGPNEGYYLPHHAVVKKSSLTTKLRVVFDASAKSTTGLSLNDTLRIGPTIQDGIFELILRFRCYRIVLSADIEKMYRQFWIDPEDRKFQKILWRWNQSQPLRTFQLKTVTYGTACAPFMATRCLKQLAHEERTSYPLAAKAIEEDMYVDDLLTGTNSVEEAKRLRDDIITITNRAGLTMCKWLSNHSAIMMDLPDKSGTTMISLDPEKITRTLGVGWSANEDTLIFEVSQGPVIEQWTKRNILSRIAQLFDPLGLVSPIVVLAKIILQDLWRSQLGWDDGVPENIRKMWVDYHAQLPVLNGWSIDRHMLMPEATNIQLHGFSDASMKAYGACIYLRVATKEEIKTTLVCAKSRVAPIKAVTLPRLELCGALLLARLYRMVGTAIDLNLDSIHFWCDSTIVLAWLQSPEQKREIFVSNRISEIKELTAAGKWSHVPTKQNPADLVSRGVLPSTFLLNELWKEGPEWLKKNEDHWPEYRREKIMEADSAENVVTLTVITKKNSDLWERFSSMKALRRFFAWSFRFKENASKLSHRDGPLTATELKIAEDRIMQLVQREEFEEEIKNAHAGKEISKSSTLNRLSPIYVAGMLRVGGRIENAAINDNKKHPIVLPKKHIVTRLLIREYHEKNLHSGVNTTLYALRSKYWIIDGRSLVRNVLHSCIRCFRVKPREPFYKMGNLPRVRLTAARPFENVGIDFCGPFFIKEKVHRNRGKVKVYIAVFVCLSIKAVHLELVGDLTSDSFIGCLRRFFARRGVSRSIYSDNGTNFVGANNQLRELYDLLNSKKCDDETRKFAAERGVDWHFSPPRTPHFGGIWEAAVKSVKHHAHRVLRDTLFSYESLNTFLTEIESILNSRPLTPMSSDPNDLDALTPGHFLIGTSFADLPSLDYSATKVNVLTSWQHLQKLRQDLWKRWYVEYLSELNVRSKWFQGSADIVRVDSMVVLRDNNLPPLQWLLGRVIETHAGDDGIIRVVSVKTKNGICKRGVKRVSPLPLDCD